MQLLEMTWPQIESLPSSTPVLLPVAALEQHGGHMPLFTDSLLLGEVVRRTEQEIGDKILFAPLQWLGNSEHHLDFPGTLSASPRNYLNLLQDLVENFLFHGFQRIVVLNGHGGNIVPAQQALFEIRQRQRERNDLLLLSATYWTLGGRPHEGSSDFRQTQMGHAGEWETSMMLRLRPELVGDYQSLAPVSMTPSFAPAHRAWITKDRSAPGHIGNPADATAEKGERIFQTFVADVVALLNRVAAWDGIDPIG